MRSPSAPSPSDSIGRMIAQSVQGSSNCHTQANKHKRKSFSLSHATEGRRDREDTPRGPFRRPGRIPTGRMRSPTRSHLTCRDGAKPQFGRTQRTELFCAARHRAKEHSIDASYASHIISTASFWKFVCEKKKVCLLKGPQEGRREEISFQSSRRDEKWAGTHMSTIGAWCERATSMCIMPVLRSHETLGGGCSACVMVAVVSVQSRARRLRDRVVLGPSGLKRAGCMGPSSVLHK